MARERKEQTQPYKVMRSSDRMEIHLFGELLSNTVFHKVLELMKENRECENPKTICFVVSNGTMMMAVRHAIPSSFYESVVLDKQIQKTNKEVLKNAAGM